MELKNWEINEKHKINEIEIQMGTGLIIIIFQKKKDL